jgi:putative DNA primase/helicase
MSAREIAAALGNPRREGRNWRCRCPVHGGHSLSLGDGAGRLLVTCWGGCDALAVLAAIRELYLNDNDDWSPGERAEHHTRKAAQHIECALRGWKRSRDGRALKSYMRGRGIVLDPPPALRFAPRCWHKPTDSYMPAMLAKIVGTDGQFQALDRTFLSPNASRKAAVPKEQQRMSLGPTRGGVVRLAEFDPDRALIIGEGIESTLSLMALRNLPGWAAVSTSVLKHLVLPSAVQRVLVAVDNDRAGQGERAARAAGQRWVAEGREVRLTIPPRVGDDWNDVLQRGGCNGQWSRG